jgi:hypothetical protein
MQILLYYWECYWSFKRGTDTLASPVWMYDETNGSDSHSCIWPSSAGRFETVDVTQRLLVSIIVLRNHLQYNPLIPGSNFSIDMESIIDQVLLCSDSQFTSRALKCHKKLSSL